MRARYRFFPLLLQYASLVVLAIAMPALVWGRAGLEQPPEQQMEAAIPEVRTVPAHAASRPDPLPENNDTASSREGTRKAVPGSGA